MRTEQGTGTFLLMSLVRQRMLPRIRAKLVTGFPPMAYLIGGHPYVPGRMWEFQLVENTDTHLSWVGSETRVTCRQEQQGGWRVTADGHTVV